MKLSRYNYFVENDEGGILVYNVFSRSLMCINRNIYQRLKGWSRDSSSINMADGFETVSEKAEESINIIEQFKRGGFLIDDDTDEISLLLDIQRRSRFQRANALSVTIVPTLDCNFKCIYCYESNCKNKGYMTRNTAENVVKYIDTYTPEGGMLRVTWFGGEPTLTFDTIYYISNAISDILIRKGAGYFSRIVTNGYLLDREAAIKLKKYGVEGACITVDGCEGGHNIRRPLRSGKGTFNTIIKNIIDIADIMDICIRYSVDKDNTEELIDLLEIIEGSGIKRNVRIEVVRIEAYPYSNKIVKDRALSTYEFSIVYPELVKQVLKKGIKIDFLPTKNRYACSALLSNHVVVAPGGELHKCIYTIWNSAESFGNVDNSSATSSNLVKWANISPVDNEDCRNCKILPICLGGCLRSNVVSGMDYNDDEDRCMQYKYNIEKLIKLKYLQNRLKGVKSAEAEG